ncbi:unnamed protein product [Vitrella brassicaformis CCMP3155]|uniref:Nudix hydrolase domain-containing protein n=2 Tax=Vitrella brassicaformis TaxID=1169539 RepID=A0A0G4GCQ3_VITBC|nr:unnamed protein product [Vitrella brassicaformis CCMP3155]|eukprot:CEM27052.1 unnamed protein product [Vitrella brassicaformis CCMP3155]
MSGIFRAIQPRACAQKESAARSGRMEKPHVRVGVGVIILREDKVLVGKRKGAHGAGKWQFPGGHLEFGEDVIDCAKREVKEETGLEIFHSRVGPYTNDKMMTENKHYITLYVIALSPPGQPDPQLLEPHKCEGWRWVEWPELRQLEPLFTPILNLMDQGYCPEELIEA